MEVLSHLLNGEIFGPGGCGLERPQLALKPVARYHDRATGWDRFRHLAKPFEKPDQVAASLVPRTGGPIGAIRRLPSQCR